MKFSFWAFFALSAILIAIFILWKDKDILKDKEVIKILLLLPMIGGLIIGTIVFIMTTRVIIIKDGNKCEDNHYLFYYVDNKNNKHGLSPFKSYVDNQSSKIVVVYDVHYTSYKSNYSGFSKPPYISYPPNKMSVLEHAPDYLFTAPPKSISKRRMESGTKYVMEYKDSYDIIYNNK